MVGHRNLLTRTTVGQGEVVHGFTDTRQAGVVALGRPRAATATTAIAATVRNCAFIWLVNGEIVEAPLIAIFNRNLERITHGYMVENKILQSRCEAIVFETGDVNFAL